MEATMERIRAMIETLELDVKKQSASGNKTAGVRARVACNKIRAELKVLKEKSMTLEKFRKMD